MQPTQLIAIMAAIIVSLKPDTSPYQALSFAEGIVDAMRGLARAGAVAAAETARSARASC